MAQLLAWCNRRDAPRAHAPPPTAPAIERARRAGYVRGVEVRVSGTIQESYVDERVAHLVRLAARGFNRSLQLRLAEHGITFGQWVFLRILWQEEGLSQRELSERANLTEPTVHTALARLERMGLIERRTFVGNRRRQHAYLTERARELRAVLEPLAMDVNERALEGLDEATRQTLRAALLTMLGNLTRDEAEAVARGQKMPPTRIGAEP
jgi:DNA-binding MarR family transcriptional regulator